MSNIKSYDFVDCLLVNFEVDKLLSTLIVVVEAYYPLIADELRKKGLIKLTCNQILSLNLKKNDEFDFDILLQYDKNGDDVRANEIYAIKCEEKTEGVFEIGLKSDFLNFEVTCNKIELIEIPKL